MEPIENPEIRKVMDSGLPKILNMGRLSETKDHETLLRAFSRVIKKVPCHLLIAGRGECESHLRTVAREIGVAEFVHFVGWSTNPFQLMSACQLFVSSSYREGFPNVLLEAMAANLPIVAADCDFGPRELLADGQFGILVPIKDEIALSEAMVRVLSDPDLRAKLGSLSSERVQSFGVETMVRQYEELLLRRKTNKR